jgi:hypothetical protein
MNQLVSAFVAFAFPSSSRYMVRIEQRY